MTSLKRGIALFLSVIIVMAMATGANAAEETIDVTYVKITGEGFVADTLNGVEARYNQYGSTLYCVELVERYYEELYGLEIRCNDGGPQVIGNDQFWFEETTAPKTGDVMFGSAAARGKGYNHWSLVKAYDQTTGIVTCFEQNWRWNGQAGVDRQIAYPSCYRYYTLCCSDPELLEGLRPQDAVSDWAEEAVEKAVNNGLITVTGNYQETISREDFCRMALKVLEQNGISVDWTATVCEEACRQELLENVEADGGEDLTREQAAVILSRVIQNIGLLPEAQTEILATYADSDSISQWAREAVAQMTATGFMNGMDGSFAPQEAVTREQAITLLIRACENPAPAITLNAVEYFAQEPQGEEMVNETTDEVAEQMETGLAASQLVALQSTKMMISRMTHSLMASQ